MNAHAAFNPVKPRAYFTTKHVISRMFAEIGGPKRVAERIRKKLKQTYNYSDPQHPAEISFAAVCDLVVAGARAPIEHLCTLAGGAFLPSHTTNEGVTVLAGRACVEQAEFVAKLLDATGDGKITAAEALPLLKDLDDAIRTLTCARARVLADVECGQ
ncbi:hypothetical protein ABEG18_13170 [Alsobacter sp. KACC 23698]|uniref:EF-hand domain-containing protein n=1 Tax=Alsobacter sp. KACC 23698 TaxID=3149229 RepID=A0AAU7J902_9HYPH